MNYERMQPYAPAILKLLTGVVNAGHKEWDILLREEKLVREYFLKIGLYVELYEEEGFAYLTQPEPTTEDKRYLKETKNIEHDLPRIIRKSTLSDDQTLLCVLLVERLKADDKELITRKEIIEMLQGFFKEKLDKQREEKDYNALINQAKSFDFISSVPAQGGEELFRIERILAKKFDVNKIQEIKEKLTGYYAKL